jgi:hypothetical protein
MAQQTAALRLAFEERDVAADERGLRAVVAQHEVVRSGTMRASAIPPL